jgi:drug/metabolite transporter (DMT)-like permease
MSEAAGARVDRAAFWQMMAGAAAISTTGVLVRYADVGPTASGFWRMAFGGALLALALLALRRWRPASRADWAWMLAPALAFAADLFLWHRSIHLVGPGLATLLANFQVFVMAAAGIALFGERPGARFGLGLALAFAGLWLLVGRDWAGFGAEVRWGVLAGLATGLCYAAYMLSLRHAQRRVGALPPAQLLAMSSLLCALMLGASVGVEGASFAIPDARSLGALLALGIVGQCLGWVLIARAMPRLPASLVGLLLLLQPSLAFALDVLLFDRATRALEWAGVALSLAGIFIGSLRAGARPAATPAPAPREDA